MSQYWEVWFADKRVVTSDDCAPHELPAGKVIAILQPGAYARTGWKDALRTTNHVFFRADLDCWTEHDPSSHWALEEMKMYAPVISCYRDGQWIGEFKAIRERYEARLLELMDG